MTQHLDHRWMTMLLTLFVGCNNASHDGDGELLRPSVDPSNNIGHQSIDKDPPSIDARIRIEAPRIVDCIALSPDGEVIASSSHPDGTIRLWGTTTGREILGMQGHKKGVKTCAFSPNGMVLASGGWDNSVRLWNVKTGKEMAKFDCKDGVPYSIVFSPEGDTLAAGGYNMKIHLLDPITGEEKRTLGTGVESMAFLPDGKTLATTGWSKDVSFWDVTTGEIIRKIHTVNDAHGGIVAMAISPDCKTLASSAGGWAGSEKMIRLFDIRTGKEVASIDGLKTWALALAFSPDGTTMVISYESGEILLWHLKTKKVIAKFAGHAGAIADPEFSRDGTILVSSDSDGAILVWKVR